MDSTNIPTTAQSSDSDKDTNSLGNTLTAEENIVEVSASALMVTKTVYELLMQLLNGVVSKVEGVFESYYKLLVINIGIVTALIVMQYKA